MAKSTQDATVLLLIEKVNEKKAQIENAENPQWQTNCTLTAYGKNVNLRTVQSVDELLSIAAEVKVHQMGYEAACAEIGVSGEYLFFGYTPKQWMADIKTRVGKLNVEKEKRNLAKLEERLDKIISPELRAKMELEAITKELE